jgi:hypothetical protein
LVIAQLPKGTTGFKQPLDRYFFRIWKSFARRINDYVVLDDIPIMMHQRDNILKLQSLIHNQLGSPIFKSFRQVAWFKCGYLNEEITDFTHPIDFSPY